MNRKTQILAIAAIAIASLGAWARLDPQSQARMQAAGLPQWLVGALSGQSGEPGAQQQASGRPQSGFGDREVLVVTAPVSSARINDRVTAIGDGEALRSVLVVPLTAGIVVRVNVASGERVAAGDVLAELDPEEQEIARDRAVIAERTAREKLERIETLMTSRAATQVQMEDARNELENARLALRTAELDLRNRKIIAPIDGIVGLVPVTAGNYVTTQTEIARIDDRSGILVDFWVPERFAPEITVGQQVEAAAIALPGEPVSGMVEEVASRVDRESRTLQVRARIANQDDRLRPGMSFRVTLRFAGDDFAAVNPLAIQWSSQGPFVWKEKDGKAVRTAVRIVQRNSDAVLVEGDVGAGDELVIEGVQSLREGAKLKVAGRPQAEGKAGS
jgi:RND family efflux transporter MFP subunit